LDNKVINNKLTYTTQIGCPNVISGLRSFPIWDVSLFPWVKELESYYQLIKKEFLELRNVQQQQKSYDNKSNFQHYRSPISSSNKIIDSVSVDNSSYDELGEIATTKGLLFKFL
jgi:hypothetical protein